MSRKLLGETFDIHGGAIDLIFPHHENEISQAKASKNCIHANYWMHGGFLNITGEKMSKSLDNFFLTRDVLKKYDAETIRFFFLSKHYRSSIDYNENMGVVGILGSPGNERIVANGHWMRNINDSTAEVAFAVADIYQRRGIGTHLLKHLMRLSREKGVHGFEATVISGNIGMMNVFKKSQCVIHSEFESGMYTLHFDFDEKTTEEYPLSSATSDLN